MRKSIAKKKPGLAKEKKGNAALDDDGQVDDDYKAGLWCGISLVIKGYGAVHSKENATLSNFALPTLFITIGSVRYILIKNNINYMVINAI